MTKPTAARHAERLVTTVLPAAEAVVRAESAAFTAANLRDEWTASYERVAAAKARVARLERRLHACYAVGIW